MANPTTYFGWVMPNSADLVTDLPADFNVFGQGVDTSMQYLLGGTTGQVLSKTSATNMAFTWTTPTDQTPLTTKGDLFTFSTLDARLAVGANDTALVADSTQSTGLAYKTKGVFNGLTTTGDTIYSSSGTTQSRLGIGSTGQVLTVASGVPSWATPASAGSGPAFRAFRNTSNQSLSASTATKVQLNGETFDTDSCFDSTTNYRFTPTTAGYYLFAANIGIISGGSGYGAAYIYKNGSRVSASRITIWETDKKNPQVTDIIYCNGTTDYVELYTLNNTNTGVLEAGSDENWFTGAFIHS